MISEKSNASPLIVAFYAWRIEMMTEDDYLKIRMDMLAYTPM